MKYDPDRHHRRSVRLRDWDYAGPGAYFVTICVQDRACVFGQILDGKMQLNAWGNIVAEYWQNLPQHFPNIALDAFVVMPNHVHFIPWLNPPTVETQPVGAQLNCAPTNVTNCAHANVTNCAHANVTNCAHANVANCAPTNVANCAPTTTTTPPNNAIKSPIGKRFTVDRQRPTLGQIIRAFKAATTRLIRQAGGESFAWQRNYYEHIIRDEAELYRIGQYILNNPTNWATDAENLGKPRRDAIPSRTL